LIRKLLGKIAAIEKNKSIVPDRISAETLQLGVETMIPYLAQLLDITVNNGPLLADWRKAVVFHVHLGVIDHYLRITERLAYVRWVARKCNA
jgi:hypothetical protein